MINLFPIVINLLDSLGNRIDSLSCGYIPPWLKMKAEPVRLGFLENMCWKLSVCFRYISLGAVQKILLSLYLCLRFLLIVCNDPNVQD